MVDSLFRLIHASAHATGLPDKSVQMICTSPPYHGLRKYVGDQGVEWPAVTYAPMPGLPPVTVDAMTCDLGLEPTVEAYIGHLMLCLREWHRVLRDDGTLWVNLGDSYAASGPRSNNNGTGKSGLKNDGRPEDSRLHSNSLIKTRGLELPPMAHGLKPKDLCGIPFRFAFAAQADGWYLRSDIIWAKKNAMPESVTDRPTKAHEYVFLLAKSARYYWDADAVRENYSDKTEWTYPQPDKAAAAGITTNGTGASTLRVEGAHGRNLRSVWTIATAPFPGSHFATFPPKLVEPCILAGTSARGACPTCGAPWERKVIHASTTGRTSKNGEGNGELNSSGRFGDSNVIPTDEWHPTCEHSDWLDEGLASCVVLDPFHGSGTTGVVALRLGRAYVGVDISEEYLHGVTQERMGDGVQVGMGI